MRVVYEDRDVLVVYKEAGLAVQSRRFGEKDLESSLRNLLAVRDGEAAARNLFVVHRLDQPVSGLLAFAKTREAAAGLSAQVQDGRMRKIYHARVSGKILADEGVLENWLVRDDGRDRMQERNPNRSWKQDGNPERNPERKQERNPERKQERNLERSPERNPERKQERNRNRSRVAEAGEKGAKKARLAYRRIGEDLLEIELFTGRHHQIRVQLANAGMPIVGDAKYGAGAPEAAGRENSEAVGSRGLALRAVSLSFLHPRTGKRMTFCCEDTGI